MRFNSLPQISQQTVALIWAEHTLTDAPAGLFPLAYPDTWLAGFRALNVKLRANGLPSPAVMERVIEWVEKQLQNGPEPAAHLDANGKCTCACCGTKF
ncbi:MAG: hypothetical protein EOO61_05120 [Hymenobacter sp.]|nr:MAG: hypothetical protein EOO61_05120 [Hymenobacter sp.]